MTKSYTEQLRDQLATVGDPPPDYSEIDAEYYRRVEERRKLRVKSERWLSLDNGFQEKRKLFTRLMAKSVGRSIPYAIFRMLFGIVFLGGTLSILFPAGGLTLCIVSSLLIADSLSAIYRRKNEISRITGLKNLEFVDEFAAWQRHEARLAEEARQRDLIRYQAQEIAQEMQRAEQWRHWINN